jgi:predicted dehydrogenase
MLDFSSNAHAVINASRVSQSKERTLEIHTEDSVIYADLLNKTLTVTQGTEMMVDSGQSGAYKQDAVVQKIFVPIIEPLRAELQSFYDAVVNGKDVLVDGKVAIRAIQICEKALERATYD